MSKFLYKSSAFIIVLAIVLLITCFRMYQWMLANPNRYTIHSHEINVEQSIEKLKKKTTPSIIIIGGSGCGFGFISPLLSKHYQMPVINTGTHAGLGLRLQVLLVKSYVEQGDIVLVIPEYLQFTNQFYGDETAWRIMTATMQDAMDSISCKQYMYLSKYFFTAIKETWDFLYNDSINSTSPYSSHSLNEYGDVTLYEYRLHKDISMPKNTTPQHNINKDVVSFLKEFREHCHQESATFLLFPPTYHEDAYEIDKDFINEIEKLLDVENIPYPVDTKRYAFPDSLFYDTNYHLTYDGCLIRTQMIINDVDSLLLGQR
ncbi:MAG: hypothetical protein ACI4BD_04640 [Paludibacteraceae bacterium]